MTRKAISKATAPTIRKGASKGTSKGASNGWGIPGMTAIEGRRFERAAATAPLLASDVTDDDDADDDDA